MKFVHLSLASILAAACLLAPAGLAQAPLNDAAPANEHREIDPKFLIKSKVAFELLSKPNPPLLIDVRSRPEFNAQHIQGAISYPWSIIKMGGEYPFAKERQLVLYCGCPHHLSGLSAEYLRQRGYAKVNVIDEGYFGWKAMGLPVYVNPKAPPETSMSVEGRLASGNLPSGHQDVFLVHEASGQLEATRTDLQGNFKMHLHFNGVKPEDTVLFQVADQTLKRLTLAELTGQIQLEQPAQVASR